MNNSPEGAQASANSKTPNIPKGAQRAFWCRVLPTGQTNASCRMLLYCNAYVMPLSDNCDEPPAGAIAVGDDDDYEWTGWMEEACEQCETFYTFSGIVFEWIELPRTEAGFRQLAQSEEWVKELEAGLKYIAALHASRDTLLQEMTHDKAHALLSSSKTN